MRLLSTVALATVLASCTKSSPSHPDGAAGSGGAGTAAAGAGGKGAAGAGAAGAGTAGTGTAGAGAAGTGAAGAGAAGTGAAGVAPPLDTSASVLTRNKHETRDGFFIQPTLTEAAVAKMALDTTFMGRTVGEVRASPLYVENGPGGKGAVIIVGTNNDVYALDETAGASLWTHSIGPAPDQSGAGCGTIHPIGIISTPVIDGASRTIYVAGGIGPGDIQRHEIHALSVEDGSERAGWPINVSAMTGPGGLAFNTKAQNQRGALSLVGGTLYVPYGGHNGDCGTYRGWVIAVNTKDPTMTGAWATAGVGEAIWAAGGMASDGNGVIAITGNRLSDSAMHQDSEEVVRVTGMGSVNRATGIYYPTHWRLMDTQDADFGSSSPVLINVPGATPSSLVAAIAKDGHFYLIDAANFGGIGGHVADVMVATGGSMLLRSALNAYTSTSGVHVVFNATAGASSSCGRSFLSILVSPGSPPTAKQVWCAPTIGDSGAIATSTDGTNETVVWFVDNNVLTGVDGDTGKTITTGGGAICAVHPWTAPIAVKGRIIVGGNGRICSWSPH